MAFPTDPGSFPPKPSDFPSPYNFTQDLPTGRWNLMINGRVYLLDIEEVNAAGRVSGRLSSGTFESGRWDGVGTPLMAGKLSFVREQDGLRQQFEGWLFQYSKVDPLWRMAGTIEHITGPEARSGWYGTRPRRE